MNDEYLQEVATQKDIETICEWRNGGDYSPGPYTAEVDRALGRILRSIEYFLTECGDDE